MHVTIHTRLKYAWHDPHQIIICIVPEMRWGTEGLFKCQQSEISRSGRCAVRMEIKRQWSERNQSELRKLKRKSERNAVAGDRTPDSPLYNDLHARFQEAFDEDPATFEVLSCPMFNLIGRAWEEAVDFETSDFFKRKMVTLNYGQKILNWNSVTVTYQRRKENNNWFIFIFKLGKYEWAISRMSGLTLEHWTYPYKVYFQILEPKTDPVNSRTNPSDPIWF